MFRRVGLNNITLLLSYADLASYNVKIYRPAKKSRQRESVYSINTKIVNYRRAVKNVHVLIFWNFETWPNVVPIFMCGIITKSVLDTEGGERYFSIFVVVFIILKENRDIFRFHNFFFFQFRNNQTKQTRHFREIPAISELLFMGIHHGLRFSIVFIWFCANKIVLTKHKICSDILHRVHRLVVLDGQIETKTSSVTQSPFFSFFFFIVYSSNFDDNRVNSSKTLSTQGKHREQYDMKIKLIQINYNYYK